MEDKLLSPEAEEALDAYRDFLLSDRKDDSKITDKQLKTLLSHFVKQQEKGKKFIKKGGFYFVGSITIQLVWMLSHTSLFMDEPLPVDIFTIIVLPLTILVTVFMSLHFFQILMVIRMEKWILHDIVKVYQSRMNRSEDNHKEVIRDE